MVLAKWDDTQIYYTALLLTRCVESLPFSFIIDFSKFPYMVLMLWRDFIFKSKLAKPHINNEEDYEKKSVQMPILLDISVHKN